MEADMLAWAELRVDTVTWSPYGGQHTEVPRVQVVDDGPQRFLVCHSENPHGFRVNPLSPLDQQHIRTALEEAIWQRGWNFRLDAGYIYGPDTPYVAFINPTMGSFAPTARGRGYNSTEALLSAYVKALLQRFPQPVREAVS